MRQILKVRVGSNLYGTNTPESDEDFSAIHIGDDSYYFGLNTDQSEVDTSIEDKAADGKNTKEAIDEKSYEIKKYIKLAMNSNPNILELLFVNEPNMLFIDKYGQKLLDNAHLFPSKLVSKSFLGYAQTQKKKMIIRTDNYLYLVEAAAYFGTKSPEDYILDYRSNNLLFFKEDKNYFNVGDLKFQKSLKVKKMLKMINERVAKASNRSDLILKHGFDTKFASHLIRVLDEGHQLLDEGRITFPIRMREVAMDIKLGKYKINEVIELADDMEEKMKSALKTSQLPEAPDFDKINNFLIEFVSEYYQNKYHNRIIM